MIPVLRMELRALLRERRGWAVPTAFAAVLAFGVLMFVLPGLLVGEAALDGFLPGVVAIVQGGTLMVAAPIVGAATIAGERERGTWAALLASPASRLGLAAGKLAAAWLYVLLLVGISLPYAVLSLDTGGFDGGSLFGFLVEQALLGFALVATGLLVSTAFARTWTAAVAAVGLVGAVAVFTGLAAVVVGTFTSGNLGAELDAAGLSTAWLVRGILLFNPGYGFALLLSSDPVTGGPLAWWLHWLALLGVGAALSVLAAWRVARLRE